MNYLVIGPPRSGKSTYARHLREEGIPTFCTDPPEHVKEREADVTYPPTGLNWSECSEYVAGNWMTRMGPWCIEGVGAVRALRKFLSLVNPSLKRALLQNVAIVVFENQLPEHVTMKGQRTMAKSVANIWASIRPLVGDQVFKIVYPQRTPGPRVSYNIDLFTASMAVRPI